MRTVDVVMPTLKRPHAFTALSHLRFVPWPMRLHLVVEETRSWPKAVNLGLSESTGDVILMDDDVFLEPDTFSLVDRYYDQADIFGFKLKYPDGTIQHAGGVYRNNEIGHIGWKAEDNGKFDMPYFTCHLTTSLVYIKRKVLDELKGMAVDYPGMHFEDVDFSFRALKAGFCLLYLPSPAFHLQSASKGVLPGFKENVDMNLAELRRRWFEDKEFTALLESYPKVLEKAEVAA